MENVNPDPQNPSESSNFSEFTDEVKNFYTGKFPALLKKFFTNPLKGIREIFEKTTEQGYLNSLILFASVFIIYILGFFILESRFGFAIILKMSLAPVIMMFMVTVISFGIKSISGKPNFKKELLTGALCGIPLLFLIFFAIILKIFSGETMLSPYGLQGVGWFSIGVVFYAFFMMANVLQQSLLAAKTKEIFAWYITPAGILIALFVSSKIVSNLLM